MKTKQRGNQEGTFYQRKDGRWCGQIMIDNKRYTAYGKNKQECKRKLRKKVEEKAEVFDSSILFGDYAKKVLDERYERKEIGKPYYQLALGVLDSLEETLSYTPLSEISAESINKFTGSLIKSNLAHSSIKSSVAVILSIINIAYTKKLVKDKILMSEITLGPKKLKSYPSLPIDKFIEEIEKIARDDIRFGLLLLVHSGLRISELRGLKWEDLDIENGKIYIKRAVVFISRIGSDTITTTKGGRIGEYVQIPNSFIQTIKNYMEKHQGESDWIFINKDNRIIPYNTFRYYAKKITTKLGFSKGFCLHVYRHAYASLLLKNNIDLKTIQSQLRHTNIETTAKYLHELNPDSRPEISEMNI